MGTFIPVINSIVPKISWNESMEIEVFNYFKERRGFPYKDVMGTKIYCFNNLLEDNITNRRYLWKLKI